MKQLTSKSLRQMYYHLSRRYLTLNTVVIAVAVIIALSWVWGSIQVMQSNYLLQQRVESRQQQVRLAELETQLLEFESNYYRSDEYQELAVRERLGYGNPGEKVLVLPDATQQALERDRALLNQTVELSNGGEPTNLQQWTTFLFGTNYQSLQDNN
ncbi:hypothetical protein FJZ39_04475 [Candidatus Saccharibacteria bacterium]|nr:hypothetical protein [Candidatus Saccharibacteria bacterium]